MMKRRRILIGTALLAGALLTGCRRDMPPMITPETTRPLATVPSTHPREDTRATTHPRQETGVVTMPTLTESTGDTAQRAVPENTIEDGNGPIPGQLTPKGF